MEIYKSFIINIGEKTLELTGLYTDDPMGVIRGMACDGADYVAILDDENRIAYAWNKKSNIVVHHTWEELDW